MIFDYWSQVDEISHAVAYFLMAMSLVSWFIIFYKTWSFWRVRKTAPVVESFWKAPNINDALSLISHADSEDIYASLARKSMAAADLKLSTEPARSSAGLSTNSALSDILTRVLRQELNRVTVKLESGLSILASIGATAPFVGLLGTVWGIFHALTTIANNGAVQIAQVAGPVGEALIMTALGLMVAIPAVLAYNAFNRMNRITMAELDAFAHDLHAHLSPRG